MAVLRFVNSIQTSPTVRLDLNDRAIWAMGNETSFGMPTMHRAVTSSLMRDGEQVGASAYGNRELSLALELFSTTADAAATQLQLLQRELDLPTNLLQYTPGGATNTVFFRTYRASPDSVQFDPTRKQVRVTVLAEPFALGIREDLASITVRNDPALANGLLADLTGIKGDVETPLFIEYADGGAGLARAGFAVGVRTGSSPYPVLFQQAESMTLHQDVSVVADATFSGGSKIRCTFASPPLSGTVPARLHSYFPKLTNPAGAENWGVYRVFARVQQTVAADVISLSISPGFNGTVGGAPNRSVTIKSQTQPQLVDLGTLDSTIGLSAIGGYAAAPYRMEVQGELWLYGARVGAGTGNLDIDYFAFVPADECFGSWDGFDDVASTSYLAVIDGPNDSAYVATALTGATPGRDGINTTGVTGQLPHVAPGNNRLVIVETNRKTNVAPPTSNLLTTTISMTCRYWPRYLLVRPVGT